MPRKIIDYSKTVIYKIVCNDLNIKDCYVGSTTDFRVRKNSHKSRCTNINSNKYHLKVYQSIRDHGDWDNWSMILIEKYPCNDHLESLQRERYWIEQLTANLNICIPSRTNNEHYKQYYELNKASISEKAKLYRTINVEKEKERHKRYKDNNAEKIKRKT